MPSQNALTQLRRQIGLFVPAQSEPEIPADAEVADWTDSINVFPRATRPKNIPSNLSVYRADERRGILETQANPDLDMRSPARSTVEWYGQLGDKNSANERRAQATKQRVQELYALARTAGAAKALGLPTIDPDTLGAIMLKEGRSDLGFNGFTPRAPADIAFQRLLKQRYNLSDKQEQFLGLVNYAQRTAKQKGVPFTTVWNGLGVNALGQTGSDYTAKITAHQNALKHPKNEQLRSLIYSAYTAGEKFKLPLAQHAMRDADPYYKSDPRYEYHTPQGSLRPVTEIVKNKLVNAIPTNIKNWFK
jgi:hypothetical protein